MTGGGKRCCGMVPEFLHAAPRVELFIFTPVRNCLAMFVCVDINGAVEANANIKINVILYRCWEEGTYSAE